MSGAKVDSALCRRLAVDLLIGRPLSAEHATALLAQLTAAADLAERPTLTEERVREVVGKLALDEIECYPVHRDHRKPLAWDIATRAAKELAGAVVGAVVSPAPLTVDRVREVVFSVAATEVQSAVALDIAVRVVDKLDGEVWAAQPMLTADEVRAVVGDDVRAVLATTHVADVLDVNGYANIIANRVAEKLAGRVVSAAQREADLREAWHAGAEWMAKVIEPRNAAGKLTTNEAGLYLSLPAEARVEREAAKYARSKGAKPTPPRSDVPRDPHCSRTGGGS